MNSERKPERPISPTAALQLLLPIFSPHAAAEELNTAMRTGKCQLWCNGKQLDPNYIGRSLVLQAQNEANNRFYADIVSSRREAWEPGPYNFELDAAQVGALLPHKRKPPGRKPKGDWPNLIRRELQALGVMSVWELQNSGELRAHLENFLDEKIGWYPADEKVLRPIIREFLGG